jgi:hypothetical protein
MYVHSLPGLRLDPSITRALARKDERVRTVGVQHGEFDVAAVGRRGNRQPIHASFLRGKQPALFDQDQSAAFCRAQSLVLLEGPMRLHPSAIAAATLALTLLCLPGQAEARRWHGHRHGGHHHGFHGGAALYGFTSGLFFGGAFAPYYGPRYYGFPGYYGAPYYYRRPYYYAPPIIYGPPPGYYGYDYRYRERGYDDSLGDD